MGNVPREPNGNEVRAAWERRDYPAVLAVHCPVVPLDDGHRQQVIRDLYAGYGPERADAVVAAANGYFDVDYPADTRSWWIAVARELRGRQAKDDRLLVRCGVRSIGRVIL